MSPVFGAEDPFAELDAEMEKYSSEAQKKEMEEFRQWKKSYLAEYQKFRQEYFAKLDAVRDDLIDKWGSSELSTQSKYVHYDKNNSVKSVVDFENNEIRISVRHKPDVSVKQQVLSDALTQLKTDFSGTDRTAGTVIDEIIGTELNKNTVAKVAQSAVKNESVQLSTGLTDAQIKQNYQQETQLIEEQAIAQKEQLDKLSDFVGLSQEEDDLSAEQQSLLAEKKSIEQEKKLRLVKLKKQLDESKLQPPNTTEVIAEVTTFKIQLPKRKELKLAKPYIAEVVKQGQRWQIEPSLSLAIMQTESYFNPKAQSHIPAYGLMQIVPSTASVDVNRYLFKKNIAMSQNDLFQPYKNIETGIAYLHILNSKYLKSINNETSREYCMIAAYNTGAGNVARVFNPDQSRNIRKAAKIINSLHPDEVYQRLIDNLPYDETKNYLKKVKERKKIYTQVDAIGKA